MAQKKNVIDTEKVTLENFLTNKFLLYTIK